MRGLRTVALLIVVVTGSPAIVRAQASMAGVVTDTSGAVLPGVTVEVASPALIERVRSAVTNGTGQYQLVNLPPGAYTVTFMLAGFNTLKREGIELTGNFTATVSASLRVGALEETVTVTGEAPTVDVQNTARQRIVDRDIIENIPAGRNIWALGALLFLYREALGQALPWLEGLDRAKRPVRLPVVLSEAEVRALLGQLDGTKWLMASLLYGAGLRLRECLMLRVKDVDFSYRQILVRESKGGKDRVTMLPEAVIQPLQIHLGKVHALHRRDLAEGYGEVWLPDALSRKYPRAGFEWGWQFMFPSKNRSVDPETGVIRRHHVYPDTLHRTVKRAAHEAENQQQEAKKDHAPVFPRERQRSHTRAGRISRPSASRARDASHREPPVAAGAGLRAGTSRRPNHR